MLFLFWLIVAAPAALFVYVYVRASVHVRRKQAFEAYPQFEPRSPAGLPPPVREAFDRDVPRVEALGFSVVGYFYQRAMREDETLELDNYLASLRNEETGDTAQLMEISVRSAKAENHLSVRGFSAEFAEGDSLSTVAARQVSSFKPDPRHPTFRLPEVDDPRLLFTAHRRLREREAPGRAAVLPTRGLEVVHLSHVETRALRQQAEFGYYRFDAEADMFRPTWKGAFLMTARQMWVINGLLLARQRARAEATLKSLGLRA